MNIAKSLATISGNVKKLRVQRPRGTIQHDGFAIQELVVVLGIISIITAILVPAFFKIQQRNREADCVSNLHKLGEAISQYVADNDEQLPVPTGWVGSVTAYVADITAYRCPIDKTRFLNVSRNKVYLPVSYGMNINILNAKNASGGSFAPSSDGIEDPASTVLLFECGNSRVNFSNHKTNLTLGSPAGDGFLPMTDGIREDAPEYSTGDIGSRGSDGSPRHTDGSNFLAADYHVKWVRPERVSSGSTASDVDCGQDNIGSPNSSNCTAAFPSAAGTRCPSFTLTFSTR